MDYFWITQKPKSQLKELEEGYINSRPSVNYSYYRESVKDIRKGDVLFFCSKGIISYIGVTESSVIYSEDKEGELWRVKFKHFKLENPVSILEHKEYLVDNKKIKYSPITSEGKSQEGYCSNIPANVANFLLSRAGVFLSNGKAVALKKGLNNRVHNLAELLVELKRSDVLNVIKSYNTLNKSHYKYQQSSTYDLKYGLELFAPKVIFGFAAAKVINRPLFSDEFSGGNSTPCFEILKKLGFEIIDKAVPDVQKNDVEISEINKDISEIEENINIPVTERQQLVDARIGQGKFRQDVIALHKKCIVTGIELPDLLRASHIKPWKDSTNQERLDPGNGLLLSASIDVLFDRGFISFKDNGQMLVSDKLRGTDILEKLGIDPERKSLINPSNAKYLYWHRKTYFYQ